MMWLSLLFLLAAPFWVSKAPADWTGEELQSLLSDSPWAQNLASPSNPAAPVVNVYIATAGPMAEAEAERDRRYRIKHPNAPADLMAEEYRAWLKENQGKAIVLAIALPPRDADRIENDSQKMEEESVLRIGRKKFKMIGHFPPSPDDPFLRLAFPREVTAADKTVNFDLYLPGVALPYRSAEFRIKDMIVNGKLEI